MFDRILFPTDGSDGATVAFEHVLDIADAHDSTVHILNVADTTQDSLVRIQREVVDVLEGEGERIVRDAADLARQRGVATVTEVLQGVPHRTIVDYAASHDIALVVMPTRGRHGLERLLLGSTTERVVRRSDVPVLTIRPDDDEAPTHPYRDVLVPTDGSDCARDAVELGADVAAVDGASLHLLTVVDTASLGADVRSDVQRRSSEARAEEILEEAAVLADDAGVESVTTRVEHGDSVPGAIRSYVESHAIGLVVVGTHGRTGFDRYLLGSVTDTLVRTSPVPVLTVRTPTDS